MIQAFTSEPRGRWRVPVEAAESVIEKLEDRFLAGDLPEHLDAWARKVHRNLLKKGPGGSAARSRRQVDAEMESPGTTKPTAHERASLDGWRAELCAIEQALLLRLTEKESEAWAAIRAGATTMRQAAAACSSTPRDLRVRLRRIAGKARDVIRERDTDRD